MILKKINDDIELVTYTLNSLIDDKIVEDNEAMIAEMRDIVISIEKTLKSMETRQMFRTKEDPMNAYIDIQSGSGGTEAQDWVAMLLRMYLRWLESHNFKNEIVEMSEGEVAGYKSVTIKINGDYAYGWLRTQVIDGIHHLPQLLFIHKLMITLKLISIQAT